MSWLQGRYLFFSSNFFVLVGSNVVTLYCITMVCYFDNSYRCLLVWHNYCKQCCTTSLKIGSMSPTFYLNENHCLKKWLTMWWGSPNYSRPTVRGRERERESREMLLEGKTPPWTDVQGAGQMTWSSRGLSVIRRKDHLPELYGTRLKMCYRCLCHFCGGKCIS